jgi:nucleotide-binding universal stress UspA family protein
MRRILVPLDGSHFAASILPDAMRLAGEDGTLILIRDAAHPMYDQELGESSRRFAVEQALAYLKGKAREIEQHGVKVEVHVLSLLDPVTAINEATQLYKADMMAVAMHGYGPMGRLVHNDIAWKAVTNSSVPVLLRHAEDRPVPTSIFAQPRRILVPLDGSEYAEQALGLAREFAVEWRASLWLVRCVPSVLIPETLPDHGDESYPIDKREDVQHAWDYLDTIQETLPGDVHTHVYYGQVAPTLALFARERHITDVVMSSHSRTGLSRAVQGSVADDLIQQIHCPIVVIPARAAISRRFSQFSMEQRSHGGPMVAPLQQV